jgi:hypothetical protein
MVIAILCSYRDAFKKVRENMLFCQQDEGVFFPGLKLRI